MTGIRSWTDDVIEFGVVVRIEHDLIHCPLGSFQRSHSPANANNAPSLTSKQNGCFVQPLRCHRKTRLPGPGTYDWSSDREKQASSLRSPILR